MKTSQNDAYGLTAHVNTSLIETPPIFSLLQNGTILIQRKCIPHSIWV